MQPDDPRSVHYLIPCESARHMNVLVSQYYIGVTCAVCLDNRPTGRINLNTNSTALKVTTWGLHIVFAVIFGPLAYIFFKEGNPLFGIIFSIPTALLVLSIIFTAANKPIKAAASKILARRR